MPHVLHCTCATKSFETMTSLLCRIKQIQQKITHAIKTTPMIINIITCDSKSIPFFPFRSFLISKSSKSFFDLLNTTTHVLRTVPAFKYVCLLLAKVLISKIMCDSIDPDCFLLIENHRYSLSQCHFHLF